MRGAPVRSVALRTRAGPRHGYGNVYRLLTLAERLRDRGVSTVRFFLEGPPEASQVLTGRGFDVTPLPEGLDPATEDRILDREWEPDLLVAEMLDLDLERQRVLRRHCGRFVILDDLLDQRYDADLVVCGQDMGRDDDAVLCSPSTELLVGYEHFLLSPRFLAVRQHPSQLPDTPRRVLVAFGGGQYDQAWIKAALALRCVGPTLQSSFVLGPAASTSLKREIEGLLPEARVLREGDLSSEFATHDLAITSAGYLKIEAAATGTPCLMVGTQWHQVPLGERFHELTGAPWLGLMPYLGPERLTAAISELMPLARRQELVRQGLALIDGRGAERLLPHLLGERAVAVGDAAR